MEGRLLSANQSNLGFSKISDWLKKAALQKSHFCFDHVNRLFVRLGQDIELRSTDYEADALIQCVHGLRG